MFHKYLLYNIIGLRSLLFSRSLCIYAHALYYSTKLEESKNAVTDIYYYGYMTLACLALGSGTFTLTTSLYFNLWGTRCIYYHGASSSFISCDVFTIWLGKKKCSTNIYHNIIELRSLLLSSFLALASSS
jgi:hypothetical protein